MTEDKFRSIYQQHYRLVMKVVYSVLNDVDFSEDICQEVFLLFSENVDTLEDECLKQWFIVTAKRKSIDFCRKAYQVHEVVSSISDTEESLIDRSSVWISSKSYAQVSSEEEIMHKLELQELTDRMLSELKKKNRHWYEILRRTFLNEEKAEDVARALGISVENLRAKKHRLKIWINKHYRESFEEL